MRLVVDTNIIFSALLNSTSNIAKILFHAGSDFQFYSCHFLLHELSIHKTKIQKLTGLNDLEVHELLELTTSKLVYIDERLIPDLTWNKANQLIGNVDKKDIPFVALAIHLDAIVWSGDKPLYKKLNSHIPKIIINTSELLAILRKD